MANSTLTWSGINEGNACKTDKECYPSLYCQVTEKEEDPDVWAATAKIHESCDAGKRWEFGSLWANNVWVRYGSMQDGFKYNVSDADLYPTPEAPLEPWMFRIWANFSAFNTNETSEGGNPVLAWGGGPEKNFTSYKRSIGDDDMCKYDVDHGKGNIYSIYEPAKCGYGNTGNHYCSSKRGSVEYSNQNNKDQFLWSITRLCHHRSTIKFWREIYDDDNLSRAYNKFLETEWVTTDDNYAKMAGTDECVADTIIETMEYYEYFDDSFYGARLSWISIVFTVVLLYLY